MTTDDRLSKALEAFSRYEKEIDWESVEYHVDDYVLRRHYRSELVLRDIAHSKNDPTKLGKLTEAFLNWEYVALLNEKYLWSNIRSSAGRNDDARCKALLDLRRILFENSLEYLKNSLE